MKTSHTAAACFIALCTSLPLPSAAQQADAGPAILGRWITESGNLEVDIAPCGPALLCGKVAKILANRSMAAPGQEMAAVAQPTLGMALVSGLREQGDGSYKGEIYNRENGKTYSAILTLAEPQQLLVRAYVGIPLLGKTQVWHRPGTEVQGGSQ